MKTIPVMFLLSIAITGCAGSKAEKAVQQQKVDPIVRLPDGGACMEPADYAANLQSAGAAQIKELYDSQDKLDATLAKVKDLKVTYGEADASFFDACKAYAANAITKGAFEKDRGIYHEIRQQLLVQGVEAWRNNPTGIQDAGKLCLVLFGGTDNDLSNFTRLVPAESTIDDCALFGARNGGSDVLLGCTEGHWKNRWAKSRVAVGPNGKKNRNVFAKATAYGPEPNCGWN